MNNSGSSDFPDMPLIPGDSEDSEEDVRQIVADETRAGLRLDTFLARTFPDYSRTFFQTMIHAGHVTVDGTARPARHVVSAGQCVCVTFPPPESPWPKPQAIPLNILYEDDQVIVLNKQAGIIVHPAAGNPDGTLVNALLHHCRDLSGIGGVKRPGIVHRLDRDTSGTMIVAKTDRAHHSLGRQLVKRTISRRYLALVLGAVPDELKTIEGAIGRDPANRLRRAVGGEAPRHAVTHLRILRRLPFVTLVEAVLETGRTHQIRVHLSHRGHPVVGDELYGGGVRRVLERLGSGHGELRTAFSRLQRPFLHAWRLAFGHPTRGGRMVFIAPPPEPLAQLLRALFQTDELAQLGLSIESSDNPPGNLPASPGEADREC